MTKRLVAYSRILLPLGLALMLAVVAVTTTLARSRVQSGSETKSAQDADGTIPPVPRPVRVYAGACGTLSDVVWPLNDLISPDGQDGGSKDADRTEYSFTANLPMTIAAMLSGSYAINVHESQDALDHSLTCGNVGGVPDAVGTLVIGLRNQDGTDVTGIAVLSPSPSDPGMTFVSVFISGGGLGDAVGTIGANPPVANNPPVDDTPPVVDNPPVDGNPPPVDNGDDGDDHEDDGVDDGHDGSDDYRGDTKEDSGDDHSGEDNSGPGSGD
ncbi:MAG TPA: hypothetical protein VHR64_08100 [Thermomicrobiales bacterium]|jgi:hypothetical protein|nr:hypothetical protein [Thermomicrobiales bacterium]